MKQIRVVIRVGLEPGIWHTDHSASDFQAKNNSITCILFLTPRSILEASSLHLCTNSSSLRAGGGIITFLLLLFIICFVSLLSLDSSSVRTKPSSIKSRSGGGRRRCAKATSWKITKNTGSYLTCGRCGGLMVSTLVSRSTFLDSSPNWGHCVAFLGKTLNSLSASLHPGVQMGTGELNAGGNPAMD